MSPQPGERPIRTHEVKASPNDHYRTRKEPLRTGKAEKAKSYIAEVETRVAKIGDIIGEIATGTSDQSQRIGQVHGSINQLDQMTQQNAALVEQSAAAAESLKDQSRRLAQAVSQFHLDPR